MQKKKKKKQLWSYLIINHMNKMWVNKIWSLFQLTVSGADKHLEKAKRMHNRFKFKTLYSDRRSSSQLGPQVRDDDGAEPCKKRKSTYFTMDTVGTENASIGGSPCEYMESWKGMWAVQYGMWFGRPGAQSMHRWVAGREAGKGSRAKACMLC